MKLPLIQEQLRAEGLGGWLVYDFRGSSPALGQLLPGKRMTTRRVYLFIPASGKPRLLTHFLDASQFTGHGPEIYTTWREMRLQLEEIVSSCGRLAMEYSPGCALPVVSAVDAGTVELVRSFGVEVVSSANVMQASIATWSDEARQLHTRASSCVTAAKDSAFAMIRDSLATGRPVNEHQVQQHILECFRRDGLEWPDAPIVGVNEHSGDPHFEVSATNPAVIKRGDWVLIDLWARVPGDENIYSDITWVAFAGNSPTPRHVEVFNAVKAARDGVVARVKNAWRDKELLQGWQLDDVAANEIRARGFGEFIRHRTGHSLSPGPRVHGLGFNLDNMETHDTRELLPRLGFTVEPGIYTPEFGVRLEINMFLDPEKGPEVTSCNQEDVIRLET